MISWSNVICEKVERRAVSSIQPTYCHPGSLITGVSNANAAVRKIKLIFVELIVLSIVWKAQTTLWVVAVLEIHYDNLCYCDYDKVSKHSRAQICELETNTAEQD